MLVAVAAALVAASPVAATRSSEIVRLVDVGSGAAEAWVFLPEHTPTCVLTFIHDGRDVQPTRYTSWLDYTTLRDDCAIVFPRYQTAPFASGRANIRGLRASVAAGMRFVRTTAFPGANAAQFARVPAIAAGFGSGGTLALVYATQARSWGFATPAAVDTVFPIVSGTAQLPTAHLGSGIRVLVQLGDRDATAGSASARAVRAYLASHPSARKHIQVIRSTNALAAVHSAPLRVDTASENAFWGPLDALIDAVTP